MKKIRINNREFFVINERDGGRYTLCVAAEPWGESIWGKGCNGQTILDIADNRNPESLTYEWFQRLPEEIKSAIKTVRVTTNDENSDGTGVINQTEMFVPSISEWILIPVDIRRTVSNDNVIWTRSFRIITGGYHGAWCIEKEGISSYYGVGYIYGVIPAFYLKNSTLSSLLAKQSSDKGEHTKQGREAYVQNEEFLPENTCQENINEYAIDLNQYKGLVLAMASSIANQEKVGSLTMKETTALYLRLKYEDYCIKHEIAFDDMTEDDFAYAYEENQE